MSKKPTIIDEYIALFGHDIQKILQEIRVIIQKAAPHAKEALGYGAPTFRLHGNLVHFAAFKNHIGFFPTPSGIEHFKKELSEYEHTKSSVRFPLNKSIPYNLIKKIVIFKVQEVNKNCNKKVSDTIFSDNYHFKLLYNR